MKPVLLLFVASLATAYGQSQYFLGPQGQSCTQVCYNMQMNCNPVIETQDSTVLFQQLGINCIPDNAAWSLEDHPSYVSDRNNPKYGSCVGFKRVPDSTHCSGWDNSVQRLCRCDPPSKTPTTFGASYARGNVRKTERWIFSHFVAEGDVGVLDHMWITYNSRADPGMIVRYYIDGETKASIEFTPSLACGVGFYDDQAPWGTEWFGKGADDGGWWNNFRIPFQKSIVVTVHHKLQQFNNFYMFVRGYVNLPIVIGGITLPRTAKMNLFVYNKTYDALDWVPLVNISSGPGAHFMLTMQAASGNMSFLEGCFHAYFDGDTRFPGVLLSTGNEDYFDSAYFFNAGQFHQPVSGFTHLSQNSTYVSWSAYRFHDQDPLFFENGFQFFTRNGDVKDKAGRKCFVKEGEQVHWPTPSDIVTYAWVYTWPSMNLASAYINISIMSLLFALYSIFM